MDCKQTHRHRLTETYANWWTIKNGNLEKPTLFVINAGPPDQSRSGGCYPKGLIVASSYKINQTII